MKAIASKSRSPRAAEKAAPRTRTARPYPAWTFEQALPLAEAIQKFASGERVSRLTLFKQLDKSPTSSSSQNLVTNSAKYGLTTGSYVAEYLELTEEGKTLTFPGTPEEEKLSLTYQLSIARVRPFAVLYERFKGKRLPAHEVLSDVLKESDIHVDDAKECIDNFIVNCKYLGLLQNIGGAETLVSLDVRLDVMFQ
ncbi:MAG: hypothetical protein JNL19_15475 [Burkholderiales bacterium]|nr:hypothetical protein [Burkholderiales bacterium]